MHSALQTLEPEFNFYEMSILLLVTAWLATLALFVFAFCFGKVRSSVRLNVDVKSFHVIQNVKYARFYIDGMPDVVFVGDR